MRISCLLFLLCSINPSQPNSKPDNHLQQLVNDLSALARVVNGIALQGQLSRDLLSAKAVTAEFLNVPDDLLSSFRNLDAQEFAKSLDEFSTKIQNLPSVKVKNWQKLLGGIQVLETMKGNVDKLTAVTAVTGKDPLTKFENSLSAVRSKIGLKIPILDITAVEQLIIDLEHVQKNTLGTVQEMQSMTTALTSLKTNIDSVIGKLTTLKEYQKHVSELLDLKGKSAGMEDVMVLSETAQKYVDNFGVLNGLKKELDEVKKGVNNLSPIAKEHGKMAEIGKKMDEVKAVVEGMQQKNTNKQLTVGLPKGVEDLNRIADDLKSKWLKEAIGNGKDIGKLAEQLQPLTPFSQKVTQLGQDWNKLDDPNTLSTITPLSKMLADAADNAKQASSGDSSASIKAIQDCMKGFTAISATVDFAKFKVAHDSAVLIDTQVSSLASVLQQISQMSAVQVSPNENLDKVRTELAKIGGTPKKTEMSAVQTAIGQISTIGDTVKELKTVSDLLKPFSNLLTQITVQIDWKLIENVRNSLTGTNLIDALTCLNGKVYKATDVTEMLEFGKTTDDMKAKSAEFKTISSLVKNMTVVKNGLDLVMKKGVRRRKSVGMLQWKDGEQISRNLGKGVEVLRQLEAVWKEQKRVEAVGKSGQSVDQLLQGTPLVSAFWTADNKKALLDLVEAVNSLNKEAVNFRSNDLLAMGGLFEEASKIRGSPVKSELLAPVAASMATSSDPHVKSLSDDFKHVSDLQLDYSNLYIDLKSAVPTLTKIRDFFDGFFNIVRDPAATATIVSSGTQATPADNSLVTYACAGVGGFAALAGVAFAAWYLPQKKDSLFWKKRFGSEENLQKAILLHTRYLAFQEPKFLGKLKDSLMEAVESDDVEEAKLFINQGSWINAEKNTDSCLHIAVRHANLEMVELLIKNGADRSLLNNDYKTPEDLVPDEIKKAEKKEDSEKVAKLIKVFDAFEALKKKKFYRKVPHLLPTSDFRIFVFASCKKSADSFKEQFDKILTDDLLAATHVVVPTDEKGVYEPNDIFVDQFSVIFGKSMLMKESWMESCLQSSKDMRNDYKHRVKSVKYKNVTYNSVVAWHQSQHQPGVPYLRDVCFGYVEWPHLVVQTPLPDMRRDTKAQQLLANLGAQMHSLDTDVKQFNKETAHPYHHYNLGVTWLVWSYFVIGVGLDFTILDNPHQNIVTLQDVFTLLLKREFTYDPEKKPRPPVLKSVNVARK